jgi:hypothetical protein
MEGIKMRNHKLVTAALPLVLLLGSGCATIINGTTEPIAITSTPSGAKVRVDGQQSYTTPANIDMARGRDHLLTFHKDGYEDENFTIVHSMSAAVAGNILLGGLIGWGVDAMDGAQDKLTPETVQITLNPLNPINPASAQSASNP